jgi:glycerol-1-phosphatase
MSEDTEAVAGHWLALPAVPAQTYDALLVDLDGVVYIGRQAVPGVAAALAEMARRSVAVTYVTNNASRPPSDVVGQLHKLGIRAVGSDVVTSAQAAAAMLAGSCAPAAAVLVIGGPGLWQAIEAVGLRPVADLDQSPSAVVQGFSPEVSWKELAQGCVAVRSGLRWIATNPDLTLPTEEGLAPGNGALVQVVSSTTGVRPEFAGKPFAPIMEEAIRRSGGSRPLVVGDRLDTDVLAARRCGLPSMLVLSGVHAVAELLAAPPEQRPDLLGADLGALVEPHLAPRCTAGVWEGGQYPQVRCLWDEDLGWRVAAPGPSDGVGARKSGADPAASGRSVALEVIRVVCAAVWARGQCPDELSVAALRQAMAPWTAEWGWDR